VKALDTNVLARFFIDDPDDEEAAKQRPAAVQALQQRAWISVTVLLEFEWVMRGFYELERADIAKVLQALCGIEHITLEDRGAVLSATELFGEGVDFADALHLVRSAHAGAFVTFDRKLAKRGGVRANMPAVELLGGRG
jgi:predicted nucleic-acid-binding protein